MKHADRYFGWELSTGKYRDPTPEELTEALDLERRRLWLEKMKRKCEIELDQLMGHPSKVFVDETGDPYHERTFIASGRTALI